MKIRTITCHDVYNSGASLQAYALQKFISDLGHDVAIINYKPNYLSAHFSITDISNPLYKRNILLKLAYLSLKLPGRLLARIKKSRFDSFQKKHLKITDTKYNTNAELCHNPPFADVYIAGSDQIWNTLYLNGCDASFYLNFAPDCSKKISYAASFAGSKVDDKYKPFVKKELANLDTIAVREFDALDILDDLGFHNSCCVCDPVFLLSQKEWEDFAPINHEKKYLLIYDFEHNPEVHTLAQKLASENNWNIYVVNTNLSYADRNFPYAGPLEFLSLIKHAQFVISNSFHATAFSLIFKKNFAVIKRNENINSRMLSILNHLNLEHHLVECSSSYKISAINYEVIDEKLAIYIKQSKQYLSKQLNNS